MSVVASSSSTLGASSRSRRCWGVGKRRRGFMDERVRGRAVEGRESSSSGSGESWGNLRNIFLPRLGWVWLG